MGSPGIALVEKTTAAALNLANVLYEKKNGITYVTVNRPKVLNALNTPTWKDLRTAFEDARDDASVRGAILTGAGDKAFIAGARQDDSAYCSVVPRILERGPQVLPRRRIQSVEHLRPIDGHIGDGALLRIEDIRER